MSKFRYSAMRSFSAWLRPGDVLGRPDESSLLRTPPREADRVLRLQLRQVLRELEQRGRAAAVVVDTGTCRHRVEVRAGHHDVVGCPPGQLGDDILLRPRLGEGTLTRAVDPGCGERHTLRRRTRRRPGWSQARSRADQRVSMITPKRSPAGGVALVDMMTASAPAAWALTALTANAHVPRWMRAMSVVPVKSSPVKSAASHPLVLVRAVARARDPPG